MATERSLGSDGGGREPRFVIIGAGMAGLLSAIKLKNEAGLENFSVYEKAGRIGGTWRENTYAGIACDVPSHLYSYSFAPNPDWSHRYSPGAEILEYFESHDGETIYPSDLAEELRIDYDVVCSVIDALAADGEITEA